MTRKKSCFIHQLTYSTDGLHAPGLTFSSQYTHKSLEPIVATIPFPPRLFVESNCPLKIVLPQSYQLCQSYNKGGSLRRLMALAGWKYWLHRFSNYNLAITFLYKRKSTLNFSCLTQITIGWKYRIYWSHFHWICTTCPSLTLFNSNWSH